MRIFLLALISSFFATSVYAQSNNELKEFAEFLRIEESRNLKKATQLAIVKGWPLQLKMPNGGIAKLTGVSFNGLPEYTATESNVGAANTTGASALWNGGSTSLNLSGSSTTLNGKIGIWDGGALLGSHQELTGRIIAGDAAGSISDHATHVAGTIMAKGINNQAKGMLYNLNNITAFDFNNDASEMASFAPNFILSNHSYGTIAGWRYSGTVWEYYGEFGSSEDYKFGYYDSRSRYWDSIAVLSPNYLIVKSSGNKRNENGPGFGQPHRRFNAAGQMVDAGAYNGGISNNSSYDIIPTYGNAKNILTVAAVGIMPNGFTNSGDVQMSSFSSWGPTDDGRIKPDISAAGVDILSSIGTSNTAYDSYSGTSMSSPNTTGSLGLVQELYQRETGNFAKSATLKALAIHTADEAGTTNGPDYQFGWGLLNVKKATEVVIGRNTKHRILENSLVQAATFSQNHVSSGGAKLVATIVWTDPAATVETTNYLNNRTKKLVNDLDLRIVGSAGTELPWKLDVDNPASAASKGDNAIDNVEKVEINNPIPGETYEIRVTHKGTLVTGPQAYALILSGVGGTAYCVSQPTSNADTRIDLFNFGGINRTGVGCTQYTNATNLFATGYATQVIPFTINLGSCGVANNKIAKLFIDWNQDGDFNDAGELIATSSVIGGSGTFSGNVTVPATVLVGSSTRVRCVVSETTDPAMVLPCGTYAKGETLDVSIRFTAPPIDAKTVSISLPEDGACATDFTYVSATFQNIGANNITTLPVKAQIFDGATLVTTLLDTVKSTTNSNGFANLVFTNTFISTPGKTYTIKVIADLTADPFKSNDTLTVTKVISSGVSTNITNATGQVCSPTQAILNATSSNANGVLYWYTQATGGSPIGSGNNISTNNIPGNRTYFIGVNDAKGTCGAINKNALGTSGGYAAFSNVQNLVVNSPSIIENVRMYFGSAGTIEVFVRETSSGSIVASASFQVNATSSMPGTGVNDLNDQGIVLPVNLKIPTAGNYQMGCNFGGGVTAFRNNSITINPYPLIAQGLMEMTSSNNGTGLNTYYWFYDMKVRALNCASTAARTQVIADAALTPTISQNGAVLTVNETGPIYFWTKDGQSVPNSNSQSITITAGGSYVCTILKGGCTFASPAFNAVFTSITNVNPSAVNFIIAPNPVASRAIINFKLPTKENVTMDLVGIDGKVINTSQFVALANTLVTKELNTERLATGTYYIRIKYDGKQVIKTIQVQ